MVGWLGKLEDSPGCRFFYFSYLLWVGDCAFTPGLLVRGCVRA